MFIEIEENVFEQIKGVTSPLDDNITILNRLFVSMKDGKHIVFCSRSNLQILIDNKFITLEVKYFLRWVLREYVYIYSCIDTVRAKLVASLDCEDISYCEGECLNILVPFRKLKKISESRLLTEHESDANSYLKIAYYVYSQKGNNSFYSICLENDSYHGSNCPAKLEEVSKKFNQAICFVDSDMKYANGQTGSTYKGVNESIKKYKQTIPLDLVKIPIREKENLITPSIYREFTENALIRIIDEEFCEDKEISDYFDLKSGVKLKHLSCNDKKWHNHFDRLIGSCEEHGLINYSVEDENKTCVEGVGGELFNKIVEVLLTDNNVIDSYFTNISKKRREEILNSKESILKKLPDYKMEYWIIIANALFDWGCCLSENKFPKMRNWNV